MRNILVKTIQSRAQHDKDIFIITGDLGFKLFDPFRDKYPEQFINVGLAEQNMVGIAAGMSLSGKNVYCYSMVPFLTMRALEFIRVDICYHKLNVKLVGVGCGVFYGREGMTHHGIEDISIMRSLPNMTIIAPGDIYEMELLMEQTIEYPTPVYLRLNGNNDTRIHQGNPSIIIGKGAVVREGHDILIVVAGTMLATAIDVVDILNLQGISATLVSMHTIKPLDDDIIIQHISKSRAVFTIEEHSLIGGLGTAVGEVLLANGFKGLFRKFALPDQYCVVQGYTKHILDACGLNSTKISKTISNALN